MTNHHRPCGLILGDQLAEQPAVLAHLPPGAPLVFIEAPEEAQHVPSHPARIALFLSAMRHAARRLAALGHSVHYLKTDDPRLVDHPSLAQRLAWLIQAEGFNEIVMVEAGDLRLEASLRVACRELGVPMRILPDPHFLFATEDFAHWARGRRQLRMEHFYREVRRRTGLLMEADGQPTGGVWNLDAENRQSFGKTGPGTLPEPAWFAPDDITQEVLDLVAVRYGEQPGSLAQFGWPVTPEQARSAALAFLDERLADFGPYQDAMWTDMPFGWHSLLSTSLNLHLIEPGWVAREAERRYRAGQASLASVEGFIRQVIGWREFMRGVYRLEMPGLAEANGLEAKRPLPPWYWTGETPMNCLRQVISQTLETGYAHHIQRLMVVGLFGLLAEVRPQAVAEWFLSVYVDAVEWVELPNVAGMALYANEGRFTSKPYAASGAYIKRMSNYCDGCRYRPDRRVGAEACPFTSLYWRFLDRHEAKLLANPRTGLMAKSVQRLSSEERAAIRAWSDQLLDELVPDRLADAAVPPAFFPVPR